jgi:hypothetical protein
MFFTTFAHAVAKAAQKLLGTAVTVLPKVDAQLPLIEGIADAVVPSQAALIDAAGNAAHALLGQAIQAVTDAQTFENAAKTGTLTLSIGTEAITDLKAMVPAFAALVHSIGLGHTVPASVTPASSAPPTPPSPAA